MDKSIMPECYADTLLIETLVPPKSKGYNHQHGYTNVQRVMKNDLKDEFALGIIDKDKKKLDYLKEFEMVDKVSTDLVLWKHKKFPTPAHFIIQICPALEMWTINVCNQLSIQVDYDLEALKKKMKSITSKEDQDLKGLFKLIKAQAHNCESVQKLIHWVSLLKEKNYQIDIKELKHGGRS